MSVWNLLWIPNVWNFFTYISMGTFYQYVCLFLKLKDISPSHHKIRMCSGHGVRYFPDNVLGPANKFWRFGTQSHYVWKYRQSHYIWKYRGGKGGFGSLLRGSAKSTTTENDDACRDLSGRRLRVKNSEEKLREWRANEKKRQGEVQAAKEERERQRAEKRAEKTEVLFFYWNWLPDIVIQYSKYSREQFECIWLLDSLEFVLLLLLERSTKGLSAWQCKAYVIVDKLKTLRDRAEFGKAWQAYPKGLWHWGKSTKTQILSLSLITEHPIASDKPPRPCCRFSESWNLAYEASFLTPPHRELGRFRMTDDF